MSDLYGRAVDLVCDGLGAQYVSLTEVDTTTGRTRSYSTGPGTNYHLAEGPITNTAFAAALRQRLIASGEPIVVPDLTQDSLPFTPDDARTVGARSYIILPLAEAGPVKRIFSVFFPEPRGLDDEMEFMEVIASALVVANHRVTLAISLHDKNQALIKADHAKSEFLARMSHELRTPMTGVLGIADLLLMSDLNAAQQELTRTLMRSARVLLDLLNDILDFSKIEAGQMEIEHAPFRVSTVLDDIAKLFGPLASEKGLVLQTVAPEGSRDAVIGDSKRLRQIFANLVNNAIKFTARGKIVVTVSVESTSDGSVLLRGAVADTGIGIDAATVERLFQPFSQADVSTSRKFGGTGLGLAITKSFVNAMNGQITAVGELGRGSTFSFSIPLKPNLDLALGEVTPSDEITNETERLKALKADRPGRVLLAEDNAVARLLVSTMLRRLGHTVDMAENGSEAVSAEQQNSYDIILMDMQMPVMDGPEAMTLIRAHGRAKRLHIPIIALTADVLATHQRGYLDAGADIVMGKPVDWVNLARTMDRLMAGNMKSLLPEAPVYLNPSGDTPLVDEKVLDDLREIIGAEEADRLQASFVAGLREGHKDLEAAFAAGDLAQVKKRAHALRGLSAQYGAVAVSQIAQAIETETTQMDDVPPLLKSLKVAVESTYIHFARTPTVALT